jgi:hypothetical protein
MSFGNRDRGLNHRFHVDVDGPKHVPVTEENEARRGSRSDVMRKELQSIDLNSIGMQGGYT